MQKRDANTTDSGKKEHGFIYKLADLLVPLQIMVNIFLKGEIMSCGASLGSH